MSKNNDDALRDISLLDRYLFGVIGTYVALFINNHLENIHTITFAGLVVLLSFCIFIIAIIFPIQQLRLGLIFISIICTVIILFYALGGNNQASNSISLIFFNVPLIYLRAKNLLLNFMKSVRIKGSLGSPG